MRKEYKITVFGIIRAIWLLCVAFLLLLYWEIHLLINIIDNVQHSKLGFILIIMIIWGGFIVIWNIYPLIIYYNHYLYDKNTVISFDQELDSFTYTDGEASITANISDITTFTENSYPNNNSLYGLYSMKYYEFFFENGMVLVVSSLVINNLEKELPMKPRKQWTREMFLADETKKLLK